MTPMPRFGGMAGKDAQAIAVGRAEVQVPLVLSAAGLRERAAPYEVTLAIDVRSEIAAVAKTQQVEVKLTVQAATSFAVWDDASGARCVDDGRDGWQHADGEARAKACLRRACVRFSSCRHSLGSPFRARGLACGHRSCARARTARARCGVMSVVE